MGRPESTGRNFSLALPLAARLAVLLGLLGWLAAAVATAQHTNRRSATSRPDAHRTSRSVPGTVHQPNRYLTPPAGLGSATNAPPGFYRQLDAPRRPAGRAPGTTHRRPVYVPYVVYAAPPAYAMSPRQVEPPPPQYTPPPPAPPPQIYIVQQPPPAPVPAPPAPAPRSERPAPPPRSREPVAVSFSIRPADAAVDLDGEPLGTGAELAARGTAMRLRPGVYVLEVVHPEYPPQRLVFGISSADPIEVAVDLTAERVGRRSRIR